MNEDLKFLGELEKKLHKRNEGMLTPNMSGDPFKIYYDTYTDENINEEEIERVIEISKGLNYVIYPINTAMGLAVGFDVCTIFPRKKSLLRFKESQLPEGYDFNKMSEVFMSKANLAKAKVIGEKIVNNRGYYDY